MRCFGYRAISKSETQMKLTREIIPAILILCAAAASCTHDNTSQRDPYAIRLYEQSRQLLLQYTDSFQSARDTAAIARIEKSYHDKLLKINFSVPPDTDIRMSEGENDTLYMLTKKMLVVKEKRLKKLTTSADTIETADTTRLHK